MATSSDKYTFRTDYGIVDRIHNWLICFIVGKKPVMINMHLECKDSIGINSPIMLFVNNQVDTVEELGDGRYMTFNPKEITQTVEIVVDKALQQLLESGVLQRN